MMPADTVALYIPADHPIAPEIRYALEALLCAAGIPYQPCAEWPPAGAPPASIAYLPAPPDELPAGALVIRADPAAAEVLRRPGAGQLPPPAYISHAGRRWPLPFGGPAEWDASVWLAQARRERRLILPADLPAAAFWVLSRWEEYAEGGRDDWGRFRYTASWFAGCAEDMHVVDGYMMLLREMLEGLAGGKLPRRPVWPDGAPFAFCVTHDIDSLCKWRPRRIVGELGYLRQAWRRGGPASALRRLNKTLHGLRERPNPHDNVLELAEREREAGIRATYFFLADHAHPQDGGYRLRPKGRPADIVRRTAELGHEVALHGSFLTLGDAPRLERERRMLEEIVGPLAGQRQHFLRFDIPASWEMYAALGFAYDSSLGFAEREGSRAGFSFPFFPYDFRRRRPYPCLEIPLTLMDATLYAYRRLSAAEARRAAEALVEHVAGVGGCFTLLWHNATFDEADLPGWGALFWEIVEMARARRPWIAPLREVAGWWREQAPPDSQHNKKL